MTSHFNDKKHRLRSPLSRQVRRLDIRSNCVPKKFSQKIAQWLIEIQIIRRFKVWHPSRVVMLTEVWLSASTLNGDCIPGVVFSLNTIPDLHTLSLINDVITSRYRMWLFPKDWWSLLWQIVQAIEASLEMCFATSFTYCNGLPWLLTRRCRWLTRRGILTTNMSIISIWAGE